MKGAEQTVGAGNEVRTRVRDRQIFQSNPFYAFTSKTADKPQLSNAMRWSKLKQQVESLFAEPLRGRVQLWTTRYEKAHDRTGRSWITFDGREVASMSNDLKCSNGIADGNPVRFQEGVFAGYDLPDAMRQYLSLSINRALASPHPLIRGLAALDRRVGAGRLARLNTAETNPVVTKLIEIRMMSGSVTGNG